ncbi:MAG: hypothetical protein FWD17_10960 [Polyangiaceae bacterium]|nr:hypothetical protein [Polyangiaceae bacterium]
MASFAEPPASEAAPSVAALVLPEALVVSPAPADPFEAAVLPDPDPLVDALIEPLLPADPFALVD